MIREYYEAICSGVDVRANLIALRNALKDEKEIRAFAYLLGGDFSVLGSLLVHEDPKVRKMQRFYLEKWNRRICCRFYLRHIKKKRPDLSGRTI